MQATNQLNHIVVPPMDAKVDLEERREIGRHGERAIDLFDPMFASVNNLVHLEVISHSVLCHPVVYNGDIIG